MSVAFDMSVQRVEAGFFRTLGHPVRVQILAALRDRERSVGELQGLLSLDSSGASQHLSLLRRQGPLEVARQILRIQDTQALLERLAAAPSDSRRGGSAA